MFQLLGAVDLTVADTRFDLGSTKQRIVLAALLVDSGRLVPVDALVDRVWDSEPSGAVRRSLSTYISRLRRVLEPVGMAEGGPVELVRRPGGYQLQVDPELVDLHRFQRRIAAAESADITDQERVDLLGKALDLWHGIPLSDLPGDWAARMREAWTRQRLDATVAWARTELALGRPHRVLNRVRDLVPEYPLVEPLTTTLMQALVAAGRDAEALDLYAETRSRLVDELGAEPGPELRALHESVLRRDVAQSSGQPWRPAPAPVARQLPTPPALFTARARELAELDKAVATSSDGPVVIAVGGVGGIGKTWLALFWAHRNVDLFPDGQLWANLRGFDGADAPTPPAAVLRGFLESLGVAHHLIPAEVDTQAALFRSVTADKRILVVLDNARDSEQILPFLPAGPSCTVLITSRHRLTGLVATHNAQLLPLDVLDRAEARELMIHRLGHKRIVDEPDAVAELIELCAGLPLAISIIAARAATLPAFPLRELVTQLHDASTRLDALDAGERTADLRAVFSCSYRALDADTARIFALVALAPVPDISLPAVAGLTALPVSAVSTRLRQLEDLHLVQHHIPGRYRMHDLVRLSGAEHATGEQEPALRRLVDHYLHTAYAAERLLEPRRQPIGLARQAPGSQPQPIRDEDSALAWFEAEHANLLAAQRCAADRGWHRAVWHLAWTMITFHARTGRLHDRLAAWRCGLAATQRLGDLAAQVTAHRYLGYACAEAGLHTEAQAQLGQALELAESTEDLSAQAHIHHGLARAWEQQGLHREALQHAERAHRLYLTIGDAATAGRASNDIAWLHARLGQYALAQSHGESALASVRHDHNEFGEAACLDTLGYIAHHLGHHAQALEHYQRALALYRQLGDDYFAATTLDHLGQTYAALRNRAKAHACWQSAHQLYQAQHRDSDAERVHQSIATLVHQSRYLEAAG
jgi:DNA-binding SARP family transcriptional activator/tetratricopeptide (TPR) repeat protein